jgi:hypothetical protein
MGSIYIDVDLDVSLLLMYFFGVPPDQGSEHIFLFECMCVFVYMLACRYMTAFFSLFVFLQM